MFWTDLLSIVWSLNTVFTIIGICRTGYVDRLLPSPQQNAQLTKNKKNEQNIQK